MNKYQVWTKMIISETKILYGFFVVNMETKKIHSSWDKKEDALNVAYDLAKLTSSQEIAAKAAAKANEAVLTKH